LANVRALVDETANVDRQPPTVYVIRLFAQQVKELGIYHANEKIERIIRIAHNQEQGSLCIAQGIQFQFVIGGDFSQLGNVEGSQSRTAGNQDTFGCLARNGVSITFSSNS